MKKIILLIILLVAWRHFYYIPDAPKMGPGAFASGLPSQENVSVGVRRQLTCPPRAN